VPYLQGLFSQRRKDSKTPQPIEIKALCSLETPHHTQCNIPEEQNPQFQVV